MRTISTKPPAEGEPDDIDGTVVDDLESLRQRVQQSLRFSLGTWFLNRNRGLSRTLILGQQTNVGLATSAITERVRDEFTGEVTNITGVTGTFDRNTRAFRYFAEVESVYGEMAILETIG